MKGRALTRCLRVILVERFDEGELRTLCFDLEIDYDSLPGKGKADKARELLAYLERRHRISDLVEYIRARRPDIDRSGLQGFLNEPSGAAERYLSSIAGLRSATIQIVSRSWTRWLAVPVVGLLMALVYLGLRDRYLIDPRVGIGSIALAILSASSWCVLSHQRQSARLWSARIGTSLLLIGALIWEMKPVLWPERFAPEDFGIAVAHFGQDADHRRTELTRNTTAWIHATLNDTIQGDTQWENVAIKTVGLVTSQEEAMWQGQRIRADLVIWGEMFLLKKDMVTIHFQMIEQPDFSSRSVLPVVVPAAAQFTSEAMNESLDDKTIIEWVVRQAQSIAPFSLGLTAYLNRDYGRAEDQFKMAAQAIDPDLAECKAPNDKLGLVYFYLGRSLQRQGKLEDGETWLVNAGRCAPSDPAIPLSIAYGYRSQGKEDEMQHWADNATRLAKESELDNAVALYNLGLAYALQDKQARAALLFDEATESDPGFYIAYLSAGRAYLKAGQVMTATERLQRAIQQAERRGIDPSWGHLFLADAYHEAQEYDKAESHYQHATDLASDVDWMHFQQGLFYENQGKPEEARQSYESMLRVTRNKAWAHAVLGAFFRRQELYRDAKDHFETAAVVYGDTLSWIYLAELYRETGNSDAAFEIYEETLPHIPMSVLPYSYSSYGYALAVTGDELSEAGQHIEATDHYSKALALYSEALALDATLGHVLCNRALVHERMSNVAKACTDYRAALELEVEKEEYCIERAQEKVRVLCNGREPSIP